MRFRWGGALPKLGLLAGLVSLCGAGAGLLPAAGTTGAQANATAERLTTQASALGGVFCLPLSCIAVGNLYSTTGHSLSGVATLATSWDGHSWALQPEARAVSGIQSQIWCSSANFCLAVGTRAPYRDYQLLKDISTLSEQWDGKRWAVVPTPSPKGTLNELTGLSCLTASDCIAIGSSSRVVFTRPTPLVELWDGRRWAQGRPPAGALALSGISCTASGCIVVGQTTVDNQACLEHQQCGSAAWAWGNGTWRALPSPFVPAGTAANLRAVSCTTTSHCEAVGSNDHGDAQGFLGEVWDGSSWRRVPLAFSATAGSLYLTSVECRFGTCFGAGSWAQPPQEGGASYAAVEELSAGHWGAATLAPRSVGSTNFLSISCSSPAMCVAVGVDPATRQAYAARWDGRNWAVTLPA